MSPQQKEKLLQLFFLVKKLKLSFKSTIFIAFVKTPAREPELDKWALIFHATKLPFGLVELQTMLELFTTSIEDLPLVLEAKEVMYDVDGKKKKCIAVTFEVDLQGK